ncbi:NYN domain-containing protein [Pseudomonas sp. NFACC32-1]|uniref:NYN domain-containing protein n=1 Tax=Pseudomonas TaxID=286 RepID=UPI00087721D7|nr:MULTISPECIES: NYN domain-containing protein [Pseudomonas]NHN70710.1 NYN domain-containing protein [Pseudomonas fluorescens]MDB6444896.1 NYN domain-containing protein [Pseudomonas sp. 21TX0197]MDT8908038.1 NYN domain-containing protein [Pseudomonas prosekii]ROO32215.1 NYN domain-containing protein [Pseudomonas sp. 7SR1]SCX69760.1 NYN domain-containing protein [Pseudomonas sp. NFACC32-1]
MRTAFFVDGYNVFYGLLAGTAYKWLNLAQLLAHIARIENPRSSLASVDYFTSSVKPELATRGIASKEAQDAYIRALRANRVNVHYGRHQLERANAPRFISRKVSASRQDTVAIWKLEEKETDVHIAISMYRTASRQETLPWEKRIEQLVLVSGDTDMAPALSAIRDDFPHLRIGVILPYRTGSKRLAPGSLKQYAHWMRRVVTCDELQSHQFPNRVPTHKAPAVKPDYW